MRNKKSEISSQLLPTSECQCCQVSHDEPNSAFRRDILKYLALAIPITSLSLSGRASAIENSPERLPPQVGDRLTYFSKSKRGQTLKASDLMELGKQQLVLPFDPHQGVIRDGSRYNQILLQKFPESGLSEGTRALSANGIVAYSAICTHAGCPVTAWMSDEKNYMCPCHQSVFNPKDSGGVVSGPAPRNLPALPLKLEGDDVVVAGSFNSWIGFGKPPR